MTKGVERFILNRDDVVLVIIDIQERLARVMDEREKVIENVQHLLELSRLFNIPVVVTEQYPRGLGQTVDEIKECLPEYAPIEKITFSCCDESAFMEKIKAIGKKTLLVTGMETHICVLQTCLGLLDNGYNVHLISDAVTSRKQDDKTLAIETMREAGAVITCTETVLFQILKNAGTEEFKIISRRIK